MTATITLAIRIIAIIAIITIAGMIMVITIETMTAITGAATCTVATMPDGTSDRMVTTSTPGAAGTDYQQRITGTATWFAITEIGRAHV